MALDQFEEALPIARDLSDYRIECSILTNMGDAYLMQGRNREAADTLRQALAVASEHEFAELEVNVLSNLGIAYGAMGNYPQALNHFRKSISTVRKAPDSKPKAAVLARDYNRMGRMLQEIGKPTEGAAFHQLALDQAQEVGLDDLGRQSSEMLANCRKQIGDGSPERLRQLQIEGIERMVGRLKKHGFTALARQVQAVAQKRENLLKSASGVDSTASEGAPREHR